MRDYLEQDPSTISRHGHERSRARLAYGVVGDAMIHSDVFFVQSGQLHPGRSHKGLRTLARVHRRVVLRSYG